MGARINGLGGTEITERERTQGAGNAFAASNTAMAAAKGSHTRSHEACAGSVFRDTFPKTACMGRGMDAHGIQGQRGRRWMEPGGPVISLEARHGPFGDPVGPGSNRV